MSPRERDIGSIGTAARVVGGLLAIGVPIAFEGIGWWDVGVALIALPVVTVAVSAVVTASFRRFAPEALGRTHTICSTIACVLCGGVIAAGIAFAVLTPASGVAIWSFFGASMLVAAVRGYGGCEILAFPNAITGHRDQVGCMLYTPIDAAERRSRAGAGHPAYH